MKLLLLYWGFLIAGYIAGSRLRCQAARFAFVPGATMGAVYILVLIMGLRMGVNQQVTSNLGSIGFQALVMTVFTVAGTMLAIFGTRKLLKIDRYGSPVEKGPGPTASALANPAEQAAASAESAESASALTGDADQTAAQSGGPEAEASPIGMKSTLIILALVVLGMLGGYFIIVGMLPQILPAFDLISDKGLVVFLCILLGLVGLDLGLSGNVVANIKSVGVKALAFPFAAVGGTLILGVVSGFFFGFSVREGIAISAGFGWYTYAPAVISAAGPEYAIAGAVSFMYNVIRETAGIILIPVAARKIGYLEATGIPGVAAMDVCMPIVERSCRQDTVVYSFAVGLLMCLTTSLLVPLVMGA